MSIKLSIKDVEESIEHFSKQEQQQILSKLLSTLKVSKEDLALLKVAESSFGFWDNPEDSIYDNL